MSIPVPDTWYVENNWIIKDDKIRLYLDYMYDHEYDYVSKNRNKYPECVQEIIREYDAPQKLARNSKLKIRALTDYDMYMRDLSIRRDMLKRHEDAWNKYKTENNIKRPNALVDIKSEVIRLKIERKKNEFVNMCSKVKVSQHKGYVPPGKRLQVASEDPKLAPFRKEIETLENEFEKLKHKIAQEDDEWEQSARYEFAVELEVR
jgi:hypothetical protein